MQTQEISHGTITDVGSLKHQISLLAGSTDIFEEGGCYINCYRIFYAIFNKIPNVKVLYNTDTDKAIKWIEDELGSEIFYKLQKELIGLYGLKKHAVQNVLFFFNNQLLVDIENSSNIYILYADEASDQALKIQTAFAKFKERKRRVASNEIKVITDGRFGLELSVLKNKKPKLDLLSHYNDDLSIKHQEILNSLNTNKTSGLYIFHGSPGTGKSTYIRYLISKLKKTVIFLPPKLAGNLDSPGLMKLMINYPDSILVIEDAEELIVSRDSSRNSSMSILLNITDGLLGESLSIKVICTFNTHIRNIDKALLRKGRLNTLYEFKELCIQKTERLIKSLGKEDFKISKAMTLAEIYNVDQTDYGNDVLKVNTLGFGGSKS